jgi:hypothetical protein
MDDARAIDRVRGRTALAVEVVDITADSAFRQTSAYAQVELLQLVDQSTIPTKYLKLC